MTMHSPSRPGKFVGNMIKEMGITITSAARSLGVSRQALNNLVNNDSASISPEMALRLEAVFGSTTDNWLRMQAGYDAAKIRQQEPEIVKGLVRLQPVS